MASAKNKHIYNPNEYLFDFIEYNGGISTSPLYREHLRMMTEFLVPDGVVGATYFTQNIHQETVARLVRARRQRATARGAFAHTRACLACLPA